MINFVKKPYSLHWWMSRYWEAIALSMHEDRKGNRDRALDLVGLHMWIKLRIIRKYEVRENLKKRTIIHHDT